MTAGLRIFFSCDAPSAPVGPQPIPAAEVKGGPKAQFLFALGPFILTLDRLLGCGGLTGGKTPVSIDFLLDLC